MSETNQPKKTKTIAFRLTAEECAKAERAAIAAGDDPNNLCRRLALTQSSEGQGLTKNQRLIYEEIARVRYLVGHGFRLLLGTREPTATTWKKITAQADQRSGEAGMILSTDLDNGTCPQQLSFIVPSGTGTALYLSFLPGGQGFDRLLVKL